MNKVVASGTEVLIFKNFNSYRGEQDEINFTTGVIISSKESEDLSYHGSPWYEQIYEVLGEDGRQYIGTYGRGLIGNSFFRTKEDHISVLKHKIYKNEQEILKLKEKNDKYLNKIIILENESKQQCQSESVITKKTNPTKAM